MFICPQFSVVKWVWRTSASLPTSTRPQRTEADWWNFSSESIVSKEFTRYIGWAECTMKLGPSWPKLKHYWKPPRPSVTRKRWFRICWKQEENLWDLGKNDVYLQDTSAQRICSANPILLNITFKKIKAIFDLVKWFWRFKFSQFCYKDHNSMKGYQVQNHPKLKS